MYFQYGWKMGVWIIVCFGVFIPAAQAQTPFEFTEFYAGNVTPVFQSKEISIAGVEGKGILISNHENKVFDNSTFNVVAIIKTLDGKRTSNSYWKIQDPDGDVVIAEVVVVGEEKTMTFLNGTGKWKGIKGSGKGKTTAVGKPVVPGTVQSCSRYVGQFELAK